MVLNNESFQDTILKNIYMKIRINKIQTQFALIIVLLMNSYFCFAQTFSKGGDVSWLPQMEATGHKFYDIDGTEKDCLQLLKDKGMNTVRLRVFVNPSSDKIRGHCSPAETIALAIRAKNLGMRIMIDFHYSDSFADPGHQTKPAAWSNYTVAQLSDAVYNHTYTVLNDLKTAGVTPEWVQIGNEIPVGMLWPEGRTTNWGQLAQFLNRGYDATKAVDTGIKVIIHLDQGNNGTKFRSFFNNATANNVKYDVIGMSYYPYWLGQKDEELLDYTKTIANLESNLKDMVTRYGKEVMIVEVGGEDYKARNTYDMLKAVITAIKRVPNNKGLGVLYWEPQGQGSWSGYPLNAWQSNGKPSEALNAFSDILPRPAPDEYVKLDGFVANPVENGRSFTANLTYTANSSTHFFYVGLVHRKSDGTFIKTIVQSTNNQFIVPSVGENVASQVTLNVPINTVPSTNLPNGEYYDITVQLWTANWGTRLDTSLSSKLTIAATGTLGVDDLSLDKGFVLYPNPVSNFLSFKNANGLKIESVKINNIVGETVYLDTTVENNNSINVAHLSSGMYILSIVSQDGSQQFKFIK